MLRWVEPGRLSRVNVCSRQHARAPCAKYFKLHFRRKAQAGPHLSSFRLTPFGFYMVCRLCKVKVSWGPRGKLCPCPLRIGKLRHSNSGRTCSSTRKRWPFPPIRSGTSGGPSKRYGKVLSGRSSGPSGGHNQSLSSPGP